MPFQVNSTPRVAAQSVVAPFLAVFSLSALAALVLGCDGGVELRARANPASDAPDGAYRGLIDPGQALDEPGSAEMSPAATSVPGRPVSPGAQPGASSPDCFRLPVVDRARVLAAPGAGNLLVGGKIVGSNTSAMNGFVDLAVISDAPADGAWLELRFANTTPYRYLEYHAPRGSYGALAEVEFYAGEARVSGEGFGIAGSFEDAGNTYDFALDSNVTTFFRAPLPNGAYVGVDLASGHVADAPRFSPPAGNFSEPPTVTLAADPDASLLYSLDGSDPAVSGLLYTKPFTLPAGITLLRAIARRECALDSEAAQGVYSVPLTGGEQPPSTAKVQSSMHIGNSLTDTIVGYLQPLAQSGGVLLDFNRYTIPGAGTWLYADNPSGGFGVRDVQQALQTRSFDHLSMQPYPNLPCQIAASADGPDSDSGYVHQAWADAMTQNPSVQLWIYQQWPEPLDFINCLSGGAWTRGGWQPPPPTSWEEAVMNELAYQEAVVSELMRLEPDAPRPYIVPGGLGLLNLKRAIEAGRVPGFTQFFSQIFLAQGADAHMTPAGAYFISLVFYACMFQLDPATTSLEPSYAVSPEQARVFQAIAWETVTGYASSGVPR